MLAHKEACRILHGDGGTHIAINPFHGSALFNHGTLSHQVKDVRRPVLNRRVANASTPLDEDLNDTGVQGILVINRSGTTLDIVDVRAFVRNDKRSLKLSHCLGIDAEIGLQRNIHVDARRDVNEGST